MITVTVPGCFRDDVAFIDLETRKVPAPEGFRMKNGEPLRRRWQAFLAGVGRGGKIRICENTGDEVAFLADVRCAIGPATDNVYGATREFDEMILRGRFTNARRANEDRPFFPHLVDADAFRWWNVGSGPPPVYRAPDCASRDVPYLWENGSRGLVLIHLLRDVAELILRDGAPDEDAVKWLDRVLGDTSFALRALGRYSADR
jgi:hypothetical protein